MTNVINLPVITTLPIDPARVIETAASKTFAEVVIIGILADGQEYFASSSPDAGDVIYHCERAKHRLMRIIDNE